jgi:hypothetical protein
LCSRSNLTAIAFVPEFFNSTGSSIGWELDSTGQYEVSNGKGGVAEWLDPTDDGVDPAIGFLFESTHFCSLEL